MSIYNLDKIFKPCSIAVIGASEIKGKIGYALLENILKAGFKGKIFPVNPNHETIQNIPAFKSITDIKEPADLAVIALPISNVPDIIDQCAIAGTEGVIIISAGGKETGEDGKKIEREIKKRAEKHRIRLIGPNCLGIISPKQNINASFAHHSALPGNLAFISQSGAFCTSILDMSFKKQMGFSYFVSIGSMIDVDFGDLIDYLGNDPDVSSIVLYIEALSNFRKFMSAARAVSRIKPIIALKAGRSPAGAKAAASHTGSLTGQDDVLDAAFMRAGIVRIDTIEELFDCSELLAKHPHPAKPHIAIITNAGGPGVIAADALNIHGIEPVTLSEETFNKINDILPSMWSRNNPIDILGDASPEIFSKVVDVCLKAKEIHALLIILSPQAISDSSAVAENLVKTIKKNPMTVFTVWLGGKEVEKGQALFSEAGIPTYETPERAVNAFFRLYSYERNLKMLQEIPPKSATAMTFNKQAAKDIINKAIKNNHQTLTEIESKQLLDAYGIPVNRIETASTPKEAVKYASIIGYPVAMKILSRDISHKTDAKGIHLNLRNDKDVEESFEKLIKNAHEFNPDAVILGVTVQKMIQQTDYELLLGSKKDPYWGPVILFGMGGFMAEIHKDKAITLPPLNRLLAKRLMQNTRVYQVLKGYRNRPAANLDLIEEILIRLSQLVTDFSQLVELDINPLMVIENKAYAVDARVIIEPCDILSPMHLAISPYPNQYEMTTTTKTGLKIFVRPIKPEDAPLLVDLFNTLSPQTIYFRFFSPLKSIPPKLLPRLTQIDYDRDIVLIAVRNNNKPVCVRTRTGRKEEILGIGRLMGDPDKETAEFAILVGDQWQGKGIGAKLLELCLSIAKKRGFKCIRGNVLPENKNMLALGKKIGFIIKRNFENHLFELRIDLV